MTSKTTEKITGADENSALWAGLNEASLICHNCQYDLRGIKSDTCPECGEAFDIEAIRKARTPWYRIAQLGQLRVYWQTVFFVLFRHRQFAKEIAMPVSYRLARKFQYVTVFHAWMALVLMTLWLFILHNSSTSFSARPVSWAYEQVWPLVIVHLWAIISLLCVTGVGSYWFHPRSRSIDIQDRAIALSYYCCAPLAFTPLLWGAMLLVSSVNYVHIYYIPSWANFPVISLRLPWHPIVMMVWVAGQVLLALWHVLILTSTAKRANIRNIVGIFSMFVMLLLAWVVLPVLILIFPLLIAGLIYVPPH